MTAMTAAQTSAFQATGGFSPSSSSNVFVGLVFVALFLWSGWAMTTAYRGWANQRLDRGVVVTTFTRFLAMWAVLAFLLLH